MDTKGTTDTTIKDIAASTIVVGITAVGIIAIIREDITSIIIVGDIVAVVGDTAAVVGGIVAIIEVIGTILAAINIVTTDIVG